MYINDICASENDDWQTYYGFSFKYAVYTQIYTIESRQGSKKTHMGLCIKPSSIANADSGVFTRRRFMKGDALCSFEGDVHHIINYLFINDLSHLAK